LGNFRNLKSGELGMARSHNDIYFSQEHDMARKTIREFVRKEIDPNVEQWEKDEIAPLKNIFKKMGELGFLGLVYDTEYGGQGLDYWYQVILHEELGRAKALGVPMAVAVQTDMATPGIAKYGSEYLKQNYLKPAIAGDFVASIAITEPDAGSDVAGIQTRAVRDGDYYIINGSKTFITNATQADFLTLLAKTSETGGYHSFSHFIVPTNLPGFQANKLHKIGMHCSDTAELFFDNLKIPAENLLGKEGEGFIQQMQQFQHERFSILPMVYSACEAAIELTVEHLKQRKAFGEPLIKKQVLRHRLVEMSTQIEALRQLTYHIVRLLNKGLDATREITMGKLYAGRLAREIPDACLQMFGGMGYMAETPITQYYRDLRILPIGGGADEVMADYLAKREGY
jgi:citronellyl-CoA dehydrogenase